MDDVMAKDIEPKIKNFEEMKAALARLNDAVNTEANKRAYIATCKRIVRQTLKDLDKK